MRTNHFSTLTAALALALAVCGLSLRADETNSVTRIGVYDSRAVAYAWFWSANHQQQLNTLMQSARDAQTAGNTSRFNELGAAIRQQQDEIHREIFSIARPAEALAEIKDRLPEIQKAADVNTLVSQWDDPALAKYPETERLDVTDALVKEFKPTEKHLKTIAGIQKSKPLPLEQCNDLIRQGRI